MYLVIRGFKMAVKTRVTEVQVFRSGATVTRCGEVSLTAGRNVVYISGMTNSTVFDNTHYKGVVWSLVAGFVDAGENLEDAVRREIREEASIEVKDIRYFGSQTWPFPSNIMIGFRAEYAGGELKPDGEEVIESGWFDRAHHPEIPRPGSIARTMLDLLWEEEERGPSPL